MCNCCWKTARVHCSTQHLVACASTCMPLMLLVLARLCLVVGNTRTPGVQANPTQPTAVGPKQPSRPTAITFAQRRSSRDVPNAIVVCITWIGFPLRSAGAFFRDSALRSSCRYRKPREGQPGSSAGTSGGQRSVITSPSTNTAPATPINKGSMLLLSLQCAVLETADWHWIVRNVQIVLP